MKKDDSKCIPIDLVPCEHCNKKFKEDRLEVHVRVCKGEGGKNPLTKSTNISNTANKASNDMFMQKLEKELQNSNGAASTTTDNTSSTSTSSPGSFSKPVSLICYLCSKEYGSHSLEIHLKTCREKYLNNNPKSDPDSLKPEILDEILSEVKAKKLDLEKVEVYNKLADKSFKDVNHFPCPNCGRKFLQDRLEVHLKGCKPKENNKPGLSVNKTGNSNKTNTNTLRNSMVEVSTSTKLLEEKLEKQLGQSGNSGNPKSNSNSNSISTNTTTNVSGKPLFLICFICGREFGKHSIEIHIKSCFDKSQSGNNIKTIKPPTLPQELEQILSKLSIKEDVLANEIVNYNELANKIFKEKTMKACPGCKRRFMPDRLDVHLRSCKGASENTNRSLSPKMVSRPQMQMCPLCGREYGSLSLPIHMKKCKEVFEREQALLPKNKRQDVNNLIEKYNETNKALKAKGEYNVENLNDKAYEIWSKEALVPCDNCGRTFLPDRLQVHLRSCKGKKEKK